jgi:hypothetical protein
MPQILAHTVEVFTDSERVYSNISGNAIPPMNPEGEGPNTYVCDQFLHFTSGKKFKASELAHVHKAEAANKKSDLNQNGILWRFLDKKLTKYMKLKHSNDLAEAAYTTSLDQLTEFSI